MSIISTSTETYCYCFHLVQLNCQSSNSYATTSLNVMTQARAAYALGGLGSGFASSDEELLTLTKTAFAHSSQVEMIVHV